MGLENKNPEGCMMILLCMYMSRLFSGSLAIRSEAKAK